MAKKNTENLLEMAISRSTGLSNGAAPTLLSRLATGAVLSEEEYEVFRQLELDLLIQIGIAEKGRRARELMVRFDHDTLKSRVEYVALVRTILDEERSEEDTAVVTRIVADALEVHDTAVKDLQRLILEILAEQAARPLAPAPKSSAPAHNPGFLERVGRVFRG